MKKLALAMLCLLFFSACGSDETIPTTQVSVGACDSTANPNFDYNSIITGGDLSNIQAYWQCSKSQRTPPLGGFSLFDDSKGVAVTENDDGTQSLTPFTWKKADCAGMEIIVANGTGPQILFDLQLNSGTLAFNTTINGVKTLMSCGFVQNPILHVK